MTLTLDTELLRKAPPPTIITPETAGFTKILCSNATIPAGGEKRLWPALDISKWDRVHFTIGGDARAVPSLSVRILQSIPIAGTHCGGILTGSTIWFEEDGTTEVKFERTTPAGYGYTGFTMSVPVVAPILYDVILRNAGTQDLTTIYVAVFAQEV